jgi:hypothetical protein
MRVEATIRRRRTGEILTHEYTEVDGIGLNDIRWLWTHGPYGCDCNRHVVFWLAKRGVPPPLYGRCGSHEYILESLVVDGEELLMAKGGWPMDHMPP